MKTVYVLFRDGENHGQQHAVGWFDTECAARAEATRREWDDYRDELKTPRRMSKLLSPDETDYRRFSVEAIDRIE